MKRLTCHIDAPDELIPRLAYAMRCLVLPLDVDIDFTSGAQGADISYGLKPDNGCRVPLPSSADAIEYFRSGGLLPAAVRTELVDEYPLRVFFDTKDGTDILATAFFWLSGWQESVTHARDEHGRFSFADSLQAKLDIAASPQVDLCRELFVAKLTLAGIDVTFRTWGTREWSFCPTVDVDYARKWRPGILYRELVEHPVLNIASVPLKRRLTRLGRSIGNLVRFRDPYRDALRALSDTLEGRATFFMKAGGEGRRDVTYSLSDNLFAEIFRGALDGGPEIGLHPSYHAVDNERRMTAELDKLETAAGRRPTIVRQHYLRHLGPKTIRLHDRLGFNVDSTLGFAEQPGFRHGTCMPFPLYDLENDRPTDVWEMPPMMMDSAVFNKCGMSAEEAVEVTRSLLKTCRRFKGCAVMLWHNILWDPDDAPGWHVTLEGAMDYARQSAAHVGGLQQTLAGWRDRKG